MVVWPSILRSVVWVGEGRENGTALECLIRCKAPDTVTRCLVYTVYDKREGIRGAGCVVTRMMGPCVRRDISLSLLIVKRLFVRSVLAVLSPCVGLSRNPSPVAAG